MQNESKYKLLVLTKSEDAPEVASVSEHKNTIFIKQITVEHFDVYMSDETGYVVKLREIIGESKINEMILDYIQKNATHIKNILELSATNNIGFASEIDVIFSHNDKIVTITAQNFMNAQFNTVSYFFNTGDTMSISGASYHDKYILLKDASVILGKNITSSYNLLHTDNEYANQNKHTIVNLSNNGVNTVTERNVNIIFKENGIQTDSATMFYVYNTYSGSDEYLINNELQPGANKLYGINDKLHFRVYLNGSKYELEVKSTNTGAILYSGKPDSNVIIEIDDNIRDIEFNVKSEPTILTKQINFTINNNVGAQLEVVNLLNSTDDVLSSENVIDNGPMDIKYNSTSNGYYIGIRPQSDSGMSLARMRISVKNADTQQEISTAYVAGYMSNVVTDALISIDVENIEIEITS